MAQSQAKLQPIICWINLNKHENIFFQDWDGIGSWYLCPWMIRANLTCVMYIMAADDMATQGARASAAMLLNWVSQIIPVINTRTVNSLRPSDAIWRHRTMSTLAQVMACCLTAPSHYLNQCWLIISKVHWYSYEGNLTQDTLAINHLYYLENYSSEFSFKSPRG